MTQKNGRKPIAAIFTDPHLGVHDDGDFWLEHSKRFYRWFGNECAARGIRRAFCGGDFFDRRDEISVKTLDAAAQIVKILYPSFDEIVSIAGNHDCYFKDNNTVHSLRILGKPFDIVETTEIREYDGVKVCFVPWGCPLPTERVGVMLGHFDATGFKTQKNRLSEHGYNGSDLVECADIVFSGHYHLRQMKRYAKGVVNFIGSPFQSGFADVDERKGIEILYSDMTSEFVEYNDGPKHMYFFTAKGIDEAKKLADIKNKVVSIEINSEMKNEAEELKAFIRAINADIVRTNDIRTSALTADKSITVSSTSALTPKELFGEYIETLKDVSTEIKGKTLEYITSKLK